MDDSTTLRFVGLLNSDGLGEAKCITEPALAHPAQLPDYYT
ncbi:MAG: hypothetical protein ABSE92_03215 [Terriglobales bacterium]|jgi:hypothetical protein